MAFINPAYSPIAALRSDGGTALVSHSDGRKLDAVIDDFESKIKSDVGSQNFLLGDGAFALNNGASGTKNGSNNTAAGFGAMPVATTSFACVAFGYNALNKMTTGDSNTALGYQALPLLTTGKNNTAIGTDAGYNVTSGDNNTLIGRHVMFEGSGATQATGDNNNIIGVDVALNATTMNKMNIMGTFAQQDGVSSYSSVVIGDVAAQRSPEVASSVLIGARACATTAGTVLNSIEIGARVNEFAPSTLFNAIVGHNSMFTVAPNPSASNYNSVLGGNALARVYGVGNVAIGYRAGMQTADTNLNNTVCIGYRAGDGWAQSGDLIIANTNSQTNPLIYGNFTNRRMEIEATKLKLKNLPNSAAGLAAGEIWNNNGVLNVA